MPVTQKDIAQRLGVSRELVKFALSGNGSVKAETRERILQEARKLGYHSGSNRAARALIARRHGKRSKSGLIAAVIPPSSNEPIAQMPFYSQILEGIEIEAEAHDAAVLICSLRRNQLKEFLNAQQVDGVILLGWNRPEIEMEELEVPTLLLTNATEIVPCVVADSVLGGELAARHLIELGHTAIGYLGFWQGTYEARGRLAGYQLALEQAGIAASPQWINASLVSFEHAGDGIQQLLQRAPELTAVVCYNDSFAVYAVQHLQAMGIRVPAEISVVGFDDVTAATMFSPAITSVWFDRKGMGRRAVARLYEEDINGPRLPVEREVFPVQLSPRDSSAAPRAATAVLPRERLT